MPPLAENAFINVKSKSHTITAEVDIPKDGGEGVIICQGGVTAGWSLYLKKGRPIYVHNLLGIEKYTVAAKEALPAGKATIRYEFAYDGGKPGSGGKGTLLVNGKKLAEGRIDKTVPFAFGLDETADVGRDDATPVTDDYKARDNKFNGRIHHVTIETQAGKDGAGIRRDRDAALAAELQWLLREELRKAREEVEAAKTR
jgi:arylsulfatase